MSVWSMMSTGSLDHDVDDGRCRRLRRRRYKFVDVKSLVVLVALALFAQQTSGVGGELAAAADRKSRKRQSAVVRELSTVEDDPYETDIQTYNNVTSNRRAAAADRHHFEFVNPKPGKLRPNVMSLRLYTGNDDDDDGGGGVDDDISRQLDVCHYHVSQKNCTILFLQ